MIARLTVVSAGPGASIQDAGRFGLLRYGVTPAGPMDWVAAQTANRALANAPDAAAIEIGIGGIALRADAPVLLAFAGGAFAWSLGDAKLPVAARILMRAGEVLRARAGTSGSFAYCAVPGGVDVPPVMGSRATQVRAALGGLEGRWLRGGDILPCGADRALDDARIEASWLAASGEPIRVVLGPQDDHFRSEAIAAFLDAPYRLTAQADRMAYKFDGTTIAHAGDFNIVSDGVALGAIQVAGDGQPMVLMADRQPTGGYPKIAHVCRADIGRLAQLRPGATCRFRAVSPQQARDALFGIEATIAETASRLASLRLAPSQDRLLADNLISGVIG